LKRNLQPGIHPEADQLSVFVEGRATAREQKLMLAHLAECAACRKAVFLMQPHEETQPVTVKPVKGWVWRRLMPLGLPAAALACGLIAVFVHTRPHGAAPSIPRQMASVRPPEIERSVPGTAVAPTTNSERAARSESPNTIYSARMAATDISGQKHHVAAGLSLPTSNLPASRSDQATTEAAPRQIIAAAPSISAPGAEAARARARQGAVTASELPLNGRNVTNEVQLSTPAGTKGAAPQNSLAMKKDLPALQVQRPSGQADTLAGVSGRITDRSGAIIAGATVTLRDAAGKTRQTMTGADGTFHLTELPAGRYELTATASGFKTGQQSIELKPSELAMLRPMLDMGTASEQVTVEAAIGAQTLQTESANVDSGVVVSQLPSVSRLMPLPSGLPVAATVSHGQRFLSLDEAGNLFLSPKRGKKWKKVTPQWVGKAVRIELTPAYSSEAPPKAKKETSPASKGAVFQLTTDSGVVWTSKDGAQWHQQ
jgi:Carboxypeptidase regulatory-like domain